MKRSTGSFHSKVLGTFVALAMVVGLTWSLSPTFGTPANLEMLLSRTSLYGLLSLGAAFVIVTGGIDLSIGSMVCLVGLGVPWLALDHGWSLWLAVPVALATAMVLGATHGLLVTRLGLAALLVTHDLGVARLLADRTLVMRDGRIVESGLTDRVFDDPQHPYTQLLVSSVL